MATVRRAQFIDDPVPFFDLSPGLRELQHEVDEFARDKVRPAAAQLEWEQEASRRVAWNLVEEASARGWRTFGLPESEGGADASALALTVLVEGSATATWASRS